MRLFSRKTGNSDEGTPEQRFWKWFERNSDSLMGVKVGNERICDQLVAELRRIDKNLTFVFGPTEDGRREFIVSADGIRSAFPAVRKLVASAPEFAEWQIIAFRPAVGCGPISIGGMVMTPEDIWFAAGPGQDGAELLLFIRGLRSDNERGIMQAAFLMLDSTLGEYAVETKIGAMAWKPLPDEPEKAGLKPLRELPDVIRLLTEPANPS